MSCIRNTVPKQLGLKLVFNKIIKRSHGMAACHNWELLLIMSGGVSLWLKAEPCPIADNCHQVLNMSLNVW